MDYCAFLQYVLTLIFFSNKYANLCHWIKYLTEAIKRNEQVWSKRYSVEIKWILNWMTYARAKLKSFTDDVIHFLKLQIESIHFAPFAISKRELDISIFESWFFLNAKASNFNKKHWNDVNLILEANILALSLFLSKIWPRYLLDGNGYYMECKCPFFMPKATTKNVFETSIYTCYIQHFHHWFAVVVHSSYIFFTPAFVYVREMTRAPVYLWLSLKWSTL